MNSALLSDAEIVMSISKAQFRPPPKVDSAVVRIVPRPPPAGLDFPDWDAFLRIIFAGKNKMLRSTLNNRALLERLEKHRVDRSSSNNTGRSSSDPARIETPAAILEQLGVAQQRPNGLPLDALLSAYRALSAAGYRFRDALSVYSGDGGSRKPTPAVDALGGSDAPGGVVDDVDDGDDAPAAELRAIDERLPLPPSPVSVASK